MEMGEKILKENDALARYLARVDKFWRKYEEAWKPIRERWEKENYPEWKEYYIEFCRIQQEYDDSKYENS